MKNLYVFFLLASLSLAFTSCNNTMTLDSPKTSSHKYLGKGLWAIIPDGYFKAENYDGYQYPGYKSSISVKYLSLIHI